MCRRDLTVKGDTEIGQNDGVGVTEHVSGLDVAVAELLGLIFNKNIP